MSNRAAIATETKTPRFLALDGLRGMAALLVVLLHVEWSNHITGLRFVKNGYLAVDLFFILSGVVISANYSTKIFDVRTSLRFLALRFFRVYPLHFAMLIALVGLELIKVLAQCIVGVTPEHQTFTGGQSPLSFVTHVFLAQGLGLLPRIGWNIPSWSISCEFVAYVLFAVTTLLGLVRNRVFLAVGAIAAASAYAALALTHGTLDVVSDLGLLRCVAGFFCGLLIDRWSTVAATRPFRQEQWYEMGLSAALITAMATLSGAAILTVIPLLILLIAHLRLDRGPVARLLISKPAQYLGRISYSVYMVHYFVIVCVLMGLKRILPAAYNASMQKDFVPINAWIGDALVFAVVATVVIVASRTYALIEQPGRLFGRRAFQQDGAVRQLGGPPVCVEVNPRSLDPMAMRQQ